jgi:hypothetical protein
MEFNGVREAELKNKSIGKSKAGFNARSNRSARRSNVREDFATKCARVCAWEFQEMLP